MSQENLRVTKRWIELFNDRSDCEEFLSLLDHEVELQTPGGPRLQGLDEARMWFEQEFQNVRPQIVPEEFVADGDIVVGLGRMEMRWIESGEIAQEFESAGVNWFREGKIVKWQPFDSHAAALAAAGIDG